MHHSCFPMVLGGYLLKKQTLDDRRFPKMHLDLQRLLQVCFLSHRDDEFDELYYGKALNVLSALKGDLNQ